MVEALNIVNQAVPGRVIKKRLRGLEVLLSEGQVGQTKVVHVMCWSNPRSWIQDSVVYHNDASALGFSSRILSPRRGTKGQFSTQKPCIGSIVRTDYVNTRFVPCVFNQNERNLPYPFPGQQRPGW